MPGITERLQAQDINRQIIEDNARKLAMARALQEARGPAGKMLYDQFSQQPPPMAAPPPPMLPPAPPMGPAPQPGSMSPGGGNPMAMGGASVMAPQPRPQMIPPPRPQASPLQIPPFKPLPAPAAAGSTGAPGEVPPPPAAAAPAQPAVQQPRQLDLKTIVQGLKAQGVAPDKVMDMLDVLAPTMNAENQRELKLYQQENAALRAAVQAYTATKLAATREKEADTHAAAETRRGEQGQQRIDLLKQKLGKAAQGDGNLKSTEFVYPKGADGKADMSQGPIGVRGITKSGKIIQLDHEGNPVATLGGVTGKEAKSTQVQVKDTVRSNIVKAGVKNSLARLDEIDKLGDVSTSSFFGQSGQNPLTRGLYGLGKATTQSGRQQLVDAKWASMIDEAIPVFTGGLRGSDAFRRFLIEQAPGPGDRKETIAEKKRLFRANINGTSHAFFDKFQNDPSMWAPGITKDQVQAAGGGSSGEPAKISGDEEFDKLPSGAHFIGPDGVERVKP